MTKIAENGQNNEGFNVVSSQMLLRRKILCQDTVIWCRGTEEKVRGPSGTIHGTPICSKKLKTGKNGQNLSSFDDEGPSYLFSFPHQSSRTR